MNAEIAGIGRAVLRVHGSRIISLGSRVEPADQVVDLNGDRLLPGLINAHDHLHRNHYPRLKYRARYDNACEWAADIDERRGSDAVLLAGSEVPRPARLVIGALKNLLSGVTTVVHHDARCDELASPEFPVHVLAGHGWAHSLSIDTAAGVRSSHAATAACAPWFIHAGEGTDARSADDARQLEALGVLTANAVLVHGLAFDATVRARLVELGVGLVWCPGSNYFLYGRAAAAGDFARAGLLALGSDSRLSGERDLLDELRFARLVGEVEDSQLESLVTTSAARLLRMPDRGELRAGAVADLLVIPRDARLWEVRRADLRCVIAQGRMRYGDNDCAELLMKADQRAIAEVDGVRKTLAAPVAEWLKHPAVREPGVTLAPHAKAA